MAKLREETNLEGLSEELLTVARETKQPARLSLWLRPDPTPKRGGGVRSGETRG